MAAAAVFLFPTAIALWAIMARGWSLRLAHPLLLARAVPGAASSGGSNIVQAGWRVWVPC